jgi:hypothetical protein
MITPAARADAAGRPAQSTHAGHRYSSWPVDAGLSGACSSGRQTLAEMGRISGGAGGSAGRTTG